MKFPSIYFRSKTCLILVVLDTRKSLHRFNPKKIYFSTMNTSAVSIEIESFLKSFLHIKVLVHLDKISYGTTKIWYRCPFSSHSLQNLKVSTD